MMYSYNLCIRPTTAPWLYRGSQHRIGGHRLTAAMDEAGPACRSRLGWPSSQRTLRDGASSPVKDSSGVSGNCRLDALHLGASTPICGMNPI